MHLITPACSLWRAGEAEAAALGFVEPYWAFAWAGGQALARFLLDAPERVRGRRVLDFGSGSALAGLAAARGGASRVVAADIDPLASVAAELNASLNGLSLETSARDLVGTLEPAAEFDLVLAADVTYEAALTARVLAWLAALAARGVEVLVADPGRGFLREELLGETGALVPLATYQAPADIDLDGRHLRSTTVARLEARR